VSERAATLDPGAAARCAFRVVLEHDTVGARARAEVADETLQRRIDAASEHRASVVAQLLDLHGARALDAANDEERTTAAISRGDLDVIAYPRLPRDVAGRRHGAPTLLVADRDGAAPSWRPVDVHNHFVTTNGTRGFPAATLAEPTPGAALLRGGRRLRKGGAWRRDLLRLAHHHRILESMGAAPSGVALGGIVDRSSTLWWLRLDAPLDARGSALTQHDTRLAERVALLEATEARNADPSLPRPGSPWWHRECDECPFAPTCHAELESSDDVSLVRFTDAPEQALLREHGITTRRALASLDLAEVVRGRATSDEPSDEQTPVAVVVGRRVKDADRLVRRARVAAAGTLLRLVGAEELDACRADLEIDVDMESYDNATYLWGTLVTRRDPALDVVEGYRAFVEWGELTEAAEGRLFAEFFGWLASLVATARDQGRTVGVYCFWEHAERAQMRRAMSTGVTGLPTHDALDELLGSSLVDLHRVVTSQLQTAGPAGLKVVAGEAGFEWRDDDPSGEASMGWYEEAVAGAAPAASAARRRLLEYNEDDCRATRALRDWLEGPARDLPDLEGARPPAP